MTLTGNLISAGCVVVGLPFVGLAYLTCGGCWIFSRLDKASFYLNYLICRLLDRITYVIEKQK